MLKGKKDFINLLRKCNVSKTIIDKINNDPQSPVDKAIRNLQTVSGANGIQHSYKVFEGCIKLENFLEKKLLKKDFLVLFYAALFHDLSKSSNDEIKKQIEESIPERDSFLYRDHGIQSAFLIKDRIRKLKIIGLSKKEKNMLCNIIAFHSLGVMHPLFLPSQLERKELLLCLLFRLADISDGGTDRPFWADIVDPSSQSPKTKARKAIEDIRFHNGEIIWVVKNRTADVKVALSMTNEDLAHHRHLLCAFGLPNRVITQKDMIANTPNGPVLECIDVYKSGLCNDVSKRNSSLSITTETLPELYEKTIDAFSQINVEKSPCVDNYFGPIVLEVKNASEDQSDKTVLRSKTGKTISQIKDYTNIWLSANKGAEKAFYFGYTHGQRIWKYIYPGYDEHKKDFLQWTGKIDQFANVLKVLKEAGSNARKAYIVIPNPIIDNPKSPLVQPDEMSPALIAIQFLIEKDNKLSAFALLRSQELSTFSIVNYFEIKELLKQLEKKLKRSIKNIRLGRIVMMSAIGYFDPNTVLLDKPLICHKEELDIIKIADKITDNMVCTDFVKLLEDFGGNDYLKTDTQWCSYFIRAIGRKTAFPYGDLNKKLKHLKTKLDEIEGKRNEIKSMTPALREKKKKETEKVIDFLKTRIIK